MDGSEAWVFIRDNMFPRKEIWILKKLARLHINYFHGQRWEILHLHFCKYLDRSFKGVTTTKQTGFLTNKDIMEAI